MSLKKLQKKIGASPDGVFGKNTITKAAKHYRLTNLEAIHFFAQISHETGNFSAYTENLNYSASGLQKIFGKYFPTNIMANAYARQPEKIANRVYANRMGNGDEVSGDGWKYRGRGAIQLTGKANYQAFANYMEAPSIMVCPEIVEELLAFESALYYFENRGLLKYCNEGISVETITKITKKINGGTNGLSDRINKTLKYAQYFD